MKDIPVFTTPFGIASLSLREVPYRKNAYISIVSTNACDALVKECVAFCRMCGAEHIYAQGHSELECYPLYTAVWTMRRTLDGLDDGGSMLFPVLPENVEHWRRIYNERMAHVPLASYMTETDGKTLCESGEGYFVHRSGTLLGIGRVSGDRILVVASVQKGSGENIICTLAGIMDTEMVSVEVASENIPAISLYQRMGFLKTAEIRKWYRVFDSDA